MNGGTTDRRALARRAYERGALVRALPWSVPPLLLAGTAALTGSMVAWAVGPVLAALLVGLRWRGGDLGRAAITGLLAGAVPYAVMLYWSCAGSCVPSECAAVGATGGVLGGLVLARALRNPSAVPAAAGLVVAGLTASMACFALGTPGLVALPALVGALPPALVLRRAAGV